MTKLWTSIDVRWRVVLAVLSAILLAAAWYLGSPLFINKTVNESFPDAMVPAESEAAKAMSEAEEMTSDSAEASDTDLAKMTSDSDEVSAAESTPMTPEPDEMTPDATDTMSETDEGTAADPTAMTSEPSEMTSDSDESPAVEPAGPVVLRSGEFGDIDAVHKGRGTATVYQLQDSQRVLRLEDFNVTNGPDLYVYLSAHPAPRDSDQLHEGGAFEVARLKGNIGNQNYELPADLDLSGFNSVVIYCKPFRVIFSTAELSAGS